MPVISSPMPRLPHHRLRQARRHDALLPQLLLACRGLASARNELRWLKDHAVKQHPAAWPTRLRSMVGQRARGRPLQYILGTEYFGHLEIACRPGVLIPRQETAASITHLVERLQSSPALPKQLRVLDLCTGTGCIPLLFEDLFRDFHPASNLQLLGVDISPQCVSLARYNGQRCGSRRTEFARADVLAAGLTSPPGSVAPLVHLLREKGLLHWDVLISNPPYISPRAFVHTTTRSVRNFEPKLALVPPPSGTSAEDGGDLFYPRLLDIADQVQAKVLLFEVADTEQALRVAHMARLKGSWHSVEIWRDEPAAKDMTSGPIVEQVSSFRSFGCGNGRSVVCWRAEVSQWLDYR